MLRNKIDEFKKKLLTKNAKIRGNPWFDDSFGRNKMKYLIPFKARWNLVSSEEEIIYGIGKIITENKSLADLEQEIVYVLTDKDLIIQSFTANAPKLLLLYSSAINNNLDITEYIREFNEDYISFIENNNDEKESNISTLSITSKKKVKNIKIEILKKMFLSEKDTKRIIHWRLFDIYKNELNKAKKNGIFAKRTSLSKINFNDAKFQSAFIESTGKSRQKKINPKKKTSLSTTGLETVDSPRYKRLTSSNTEERLPTLDKDKEKEKFIEFKDVNISEINELINDKASKDRVYYQRPIHHRFSLSVKEVKINEYKVGYLFKFEPYNSKILEETNISKANKNQMILKHELSSMNKPDLNDIDKSEISVMSFANKPLEQRNSLILPTADNPFGISCENNDLFSMKLNNEKENEFTIDLKHMAYRQFGLNCMNDKSEENALYELLRQEAVEKISKVAKQVKKEEVSEEEEESSSGSYYSSDENSQNNSESSSGRKDDESSQHSIKDAISNEITPKKSENNTNIGKKNNSVKESNKNIPVITNIPSPSKNNNYNLEKLTNLNNQKHKEEEYYHVNMNNITYYIYNYTTGFIEAIKDQKYKQSQVVKQINSEKEKLSKMNAKYIANPKLAKEKKRGNISKKISNDEDESSSFSEKTMKLKEIQKALTSKEKQSSIINLCLFSFIIFALIIGTSIMSIMINYYLKDKTYMFYSLIRNSIELFKNILFEITFVREMLIINSTYYNNYYDQDKDAYYYDYRRLCYYSIEFNYKFKYFK